MLPGQTNLFNLQKQWRPRTDGAQVLIIKCLMFQNVSPFRVGNFCDQTSNLHFYQIYTKNVKTREQKHCAIKSDECVLT